MFSCICGRTSKIFDPALNEVENKLITSTSKKDSFEEDDGLIKLSKNYDKHISIRVSDYVTKSNFSFKAPTASLSSSSSPSSSEQNSQKVKFTPKTLPQTQLQTPKKPKMLDYCVSEENFKVTCLDSSSDSVIEEVIIVRPSKKFSEGTVVFGQFVEIDSQEEINKHSYEVKVDYSTKYGRYMVTQKPLSNQNNSKHF
ncbi:MAG: hypothetical protein FJZ56_03075 [Chlamydiae bacterium]|nr:hypothetical protein [Chlamydiota bacterium]